MASAELFQCLAKFTRQLHSSLSTAGRKALSEEFTMKNCQSKGNFFIEMGAVKKLLDLWDNVLIDLEKVSVHLEKGDKISIINSSKQLARSVTALQTFIAGVFVEIGSFVPGPIGIVCSVALAIGCFATGNVAGGFLNLLGAIPFVKCAKFLSKTEFLRMVSNSGLNAFKPLGFERYMSALSAKISEIPYTKSFTSIFEKAIEKTQKASTSSAIKCVGSSDKLLDTTIDGWEKARLELLEQKTVEYMFRESIFTRY